MHLNESSPPSGEPSAERLRELVNVAPSLRQSRSTRPRRRPPPETMATKTDVPTSQASPDLWVVGISSCFTASPGTPARPAGQAAPQHDPRAGHRGDHGRRSGRAADPCLRDAVTVYRGTDRGSAGTAVVTRRLRRPGQPAAASSERGGVAVSASQGLRRRNPGGPSACPQLATAALKALHEELQPEPGDLVFCTTTAQALDAANVLRSFRAVCTAAGIGPDWTPLTSRRRFVGRHPGGRTLGR